MIFFSDTILHRYTYTSAGTGLYGESVKEYVYTDDIPCDFQNETNTEISKEYGVDLQNLYKCYIDINVTVNDTDQLRDDAGNTYHIIGNIQKYPKYHKYQKLHLVKNRKC